MLHKSTISFLPNRNVSKSKQVNISIGLARTVTVPEDEVIYTPNKLSLTKPLKEIRSKEKEDHLVKRKNLDIYDYDNPSKKIAIGRNRSNENHYRSARDSSQECPVATLSNMGNTCFLNSVLYILRFAPTFLHNLHHLIGDLTLINSRLNQNKAKSSSLGRNVGSISGPSTSSKDLLSLGNLDVILEDTEEPEAQIVTETLHELFMTMHNLELKDSGDPYQPSAFWSSFRKANKIFKVNEEQDAEELLIYLLCYIRKTSVFITQLVENQPNLLNDPEISLSSTRKNFLSFRQSWNNKKKDINHKNLINEEKIKKKIGYNSVAEEFEGIMCTHTTCFECKEIVERKQPFYDIPVAISDEDCKENPNEIFRKACITSEKLCDYFCSNCKRSNEASHDVLYEKLPNIMVLQLKRFITTPAGVQKVNSYLPTPLELDCFCESCCQLQNGLLLHRYELCGVIMHLGPNTTLGHYTAYVKITDHLKDYTDCSRDLPRGTLSASSSEKSVNILKLFKTTASKSGGGIGVCKSIDCCGIKLNKNIVENVVNSYGKKHALERWQQSSNDVQEDMWLQCDDHNVRPISNKEFQELLGHKASSNSTPYLLFYSKITDAPISE